MGISTTAVAIIAGVILLVVVVLAVITRYKVAGPNQVFIVTGRKGKDASDLSGQKVVVAGGVFVVPFVQRLSTLDLSSRRITVAIRQAVTKQGISVNIEGVAIVKIGSDADSIRAAAQRFADQPDQIVPTTTENLAGALRSIIGQLTVEEIIRDRAAFASKVAEATESALTSQGLELDAFQIQEIDTDGSYIRDLGRAEAARVSQEAAIAEAKAKQATQEAQLAADQRILDANRSFALRQAEIKAETDAAQAQAAAAGPIAAAARQQEVLRAEELVAVQQAALTERKLETEVRKPADANRYRVEQEALGSKNSAIFRAEAEKAATIAAAEAESEQARLSGVGEKSRRAAIAEAVTLEGAASASAIAATGGAEAEAMEKKAAAYQNYSQAAVLELIIARLPEIAREMAAPMGNIDKLTVISTDGAGALPKAVTNNMMQLNQLVGDTLGVDLSTLVKGITEGFMPATTDGSVTATTPSVTTTPAV